ncbi:protein MpR2R3-MYB19 [Marchantia polymorpha subsp. ruderalis]|uniref:Uncharacterized protein n=2 Tax=Marchantia polymorpha TaxID=3197 RepID=A0A176VE16_MARPO|nr:hypothetical protein AXG93_1702s1000 [Marchantia polymorpha subsp. ruderalis]PTQ26835.1 hypothetical protein MARPO_0318s0001 [Marchantia polymorpha]BBN11572.1 hypothetical protein Mp_5g13060 [Marchantia polymorpha subsp. ruderalis]|eukprot:PTQ26835.1 hypothetical protein MARPO_0318s0001 [Marchantia polymorpha]
MEGSSSLTLPKLPLRRCLEDISNSSEPNLPSAAFVDSPLDKKETMNYEQLSKVQRKKLETNCCEFTEPVRYSVTSPLAEGSQSNVKGYWIKEEDDKMLELVNTLGTKSWAAIASSLPGRNGKQCRERWFNHLDPQLKKEPWSEAEDIMLFWAHQRFGNRWADIAKIIPGRSENSIKNRWNTGLKKRAAALEDYSENWVNKNTFGELSSLSDNVAPTNLDASQDILVFNGQPNTHLQDSNATEDLLALNSEFGADEFDDMDVDDDNVPEFDMDVDDDIPPEFDVDVVDDCFPDFDDFCL